LDNKVIDIIDSRLWPWRLCPHSVLKSRSSHIRPRAVSYVRSIIVLVTQQDRMLYTAPTTDCSVIN